MREQEHLGLCLGALSLHVDHIARGRVEPQPVLLGRVPPQVVLVVYVAERVIYEALGDAVLVQVGVLDVVRYIGSTLSNVDNGCLVLASQETEGLNEVLADDRLDVDNPCEGPHLRVTIASEIPCDLNLRCLRLPLGRDWDLALKVGDNCAGNELGWDLRTEGSLGEEG